MKVKIIAVDFDGTMCTDEWPDIGKPNHKVLNYLKTQKERGAKLILWTCRNGANLEAAVRWCERMGITFDSVNQNLPESIAAFGSDTRKVFAHEYIDDRSCTRFKFNHKELDGDGE